MFGYISIDKPEMKVRDFETFRAYYCGLCRQIRRDYGQLPRLVLSYDCTFLYILGAALEDSIPEYAKKRCPVSPIRKRGFAATDKEHGFGAVPDLIIVDGGKGQLGSAVSVLESLGLEDMNIVGLAKREEEIFLPGESEPIVLAKNAPELRLITAIRDEAHRFAITYHRALRQNRTLASELDRIAGVGNKRKLLLLEAFGDLEGIRGASVEELSAVKGVDIRTARAVYQYFHE